MAKPTEKAIIEQAYRFLGAWAEFGSQDDRTARVQNGLFERLHAYDERRYMREMFSKFKKED